MQTVFLKDGRQANLISKTDSGYIVEPFETYKDYETKEEYTEPCGDVLKVDKVYDQAPLSFIQDDYAKILSKVKAQESLLEEKKGELLRVQSEVRALQNTKTDLSKYIINRSEFKKAKRLIVWLDRQIAPLVMDGVESLKFTICYEIGQWKNGEEKCWVSKGWGDSYNSPQSWGSSQYWDGEYGIKVDLTDEQILEISLERLAKKPEDYFWSNQILHTPDKWLSATYLEKKKRIKEQEGKIELEKAKEELCAATEKYQKLMNELTVS